MYWESVMTEVQWCNIKSWEIEMTKLWRQETRSKWELLTEQREIIYEATQASVHREGLQAAQSLITGIRQSISSKLAGESVREGDKWPWRISSRQGGTYLWLGLSGKALRWWCRVLWPGCVLASSPERCASVSAPASSSTTALSAR